MRYMVKYTLKYDRQIKVYESDIFSSLSAAYLECDLIKKVHDNKIKTMIIVVDDEGQGRIDNAGKFFLYRIIK